MSVHRPEYTKVKTIDLPGREKLLSLETPEKVEDENYYSCAIAAGTLLLAEELTRLEHKKSREQKKHRVLALKRSLLREAFPKFTAGLSLEGDAGKLLSDSRLGDKATEYIIDLAFTNPFAPYELKFKNKHFTSALGNVAALVRLSVEDVKRIRHTQRKALKAYRHVHWKKIMAYGLSRLAVIGVAGFLFAPLLVGAVGTAAGLTGVAATTQGLVTLGGGSLALAGVRLAGGLWLVRATGGFFGRDRHGTAFTAWPKERKG